MRCPLLPRHGTRVEDLTAGCYEEWLDAVRTEAAALRSRSRRLFVVGMSLGSLLVLRLAEEGVVAVDGVVALSPALRAHRLLPLAILARHVLRSDPQAPIDDRVDPTTASRNWCYDRTPPWGAGEVWRLQRLVRRDLRAVHQPLLSVQGRHDRTVQPDSGAAVLRGVSSTDKALRWLERSGHNVLLDGEGEALNAGIAAWIAARV